MAMALTADPHDTLMPRSPTTVANSLRQCVDEFASAAAIAARQYLIVSRAIRTAVAS